MVTIGLKRNGLDKYYTNQNVANQCVSYLMSHININETDLIIEPSAGSGSFIDAINKLKCNKLYLDIAPEHTLITQCNFFDFQLTESFTKIHIVGNPPFGRQSSLAKKFIKKSVMFADTISFILPKSFKKNSMQQIFPKSFHLVFEVDIPPKSFHINNQLINIPCIFQIWEKRDFQRLTQRKLTPKNFEFVLKNQNPNFAFRRVGGNAGKISINVSDKNKQSHYFIKLHNIKDYDEFKKEITNINWEFNNTVGPRSISKQELLSKLTDKWVN